MDTRSDDHVLDVLRAFAGGPVLSVGVAITVLCGPARIEGVLANSSDYSEHLGEELSATFRETAATAGDEPTPILLLREARVWGPGYDPQHGSSEVPFVRIRVAAISAWWLGTSSR